MPPKKNLRGHVNGPLDPLGIVLVACVDVAPPFGSPLVMDTWNPLPDPLLTLSGVPPQQPWPAWTLTSRPAFASSNWGAQRRPTSASQLSTLRLN